MVVNVFIYIVCIKDIKSICVLNIDRKAIPSIHWYEMCTMKDWVHMNNIHLSLTICIMFQFHNPQPCVFISFIRNWYVPLNECGRVFDTIMGKGKKKENPPNVQSFHPKFILVLFQENGIISCMAFSPAWCTPNTFWVHASKSQQITWCIECCYSTMEDWYRQVRNVRLGCCSVHICAIPSQLKMKEMSNKEGKVGLENMVCERA